MARAPKGKSGERKTVDWKSARVVALYGPDVFLQAEYIRHARESLAALHGGDDGFTIVKFDGDSTTLADILDECRSYDLMQRPKLVIVENGERILGVERNRDIMMSYCESPSDLATLVLRCDKWLWTKLEAAVNEAGAAIKCEHDTPEKAAGWAVRRAEKRHGAKLPEDAAVAIVERVGADLGRIDSELNKLAVASDDGTISTDLVRELVARTIEADNLFEIQGPLATGDAPTAVRGVHEALTLWREAPTGVCFAAIDLIRKCHNVARLVEGGLPPFVAVGKAKVWQNKEAILRLAGQAPASRWAALLDWALELDVRCKTGFADAAIAADTLAVQIASAAGGSRR